MNMILRYLYRFLFLFTLNLYAVEIDICSEQYNCDDSHHYFYAYFQEGFPLDIDNLININGDYGDQKYFFNEQSSDWLYLLYLDNNYQEVIDSVSNQPGFVSIERLTNETVFFDKGLLLDTLEQNPDVVINVRLWSDSWFDKLYPGKEYFTIHHQGIEVITEYGTGEFDVQVTSRLELESLMGDLAVYSIRLLSEGDPISILSSDRLNKFSIKRIVDIKGNEIQFNSKTVNEFLLDNSIAAGVYLVELNNFGRSSFVRVQVR